jgi:hypothetical protein
MRICPISLAGGVAVVGGIGRRGYVLVSKANVRSGR